MVSILAGALFAQLALNSELSSGSGLALFQAVLALFGVCILAWVVLRFASRAGVGRVRSGARVKVIERVVLEPRRALYVIEIDGRTLLIGTGDGASPRLLAELEPSVDTRGSANDAPADVAEAK